MSGALASGIYEGWVRHRRLAPVAHDFVFPLYMLWLDLSELGRVFEGSRLWSLEGPAVVEFRRSDYLGDPGVALDAAVRDVVEERTGRRPTGAVRALTLGRSFGHCFNPVSFYTCHAPEEGGGGGGVESIVAEITNTPWLERHRHVLPVREGEEVGPGAWRFRFGKEFHVSPFMPMDMSYDWTLRLPGERGRRSGAFVHMVNLRGGERVFDATLALRRREATAANLRRAALRFPAMAAMAVAKIHWEALKLWAKGAPVHPHPAPGSTGARA